VWTSGSIDIRTDDAHQVRFALSDTGFLQKFVQGAPGTTYNPSDPSTWYLWEDIGVQANAPFHQLCPACQNDGMLETEDKNLNGALDAACGPDTPNFCEDEGWLYEIPPGTRSIDEALRMPCPGCAKNGVLDTEDANGNGYLDRYLVYGLDVCSTPQGIGNARCSGTSVPSTPRYLWPEECPMAPANLGPFQAAKESGCPPFLIPHNAPDPNDPNNPDKCQIDNSTGKCLLIYPSFQGTAADNASDTYIIQGGRIRMGGFGLGVGVKFTF
jgi:hypothetical protein